MLRPDRLLEVGDHLALLRHPVELAVCSDDSEHGSLLCDLVDELRAVSELVSVSAEEHVRRPSVLVRRPGRPGGLRFAGAPLGDALSALVLGVLHVGGHPPRISAGAADRIAAWSVPVDLETWYATSCGSCRDTLHAFGVIAALNPTVRHTAVNGAAFTEEAAARGVVSVPMVFVNGERLTQGRMGVDAAVDVLEALVG